MKTRRYRQGGVLRDVELEEAFPMSRNKRVEAMVSPTWNVGCLNKKRATHIVEQTKRYVLVNIDIWWCGNSDQGEPRVDMLPGSVDK